MTAKNTNKYIVSIAGPTAVGKTGIAIEVARHFNTVILSADSRQMYRQMSIGTAKPTPEELESIPHFFIDSLDISETYTAGDYERDALALIDRKFEDHNVIVIAGGTGLYHRAVLDGFDAIPSTSIAIREKWQRLFEEHGLEFLQQNIRSLDPAYALEVDLQNSRRLVRALSFIDETSERFSDFRKNTPQKRRFKSIRVFCNMERAELYKRINDRVDLMMGTGLLGEVKSLIEFQSAQALQTVGYRELFEHLNGDLSLEEAIDKIKQHSRNYAKRQITWFRNQGDWWECNPPDSRQIINHINNKINL